MVPETSPCPAEDELIHLLSGGYVAQEPAVAQHLLSGCVSCWTKLSQEMARLDSNTVPLNEPMAMAVAAAALAQNNPAAERLLWMPPQHAADARKAPQDPVAFCRLVLHEAVPAIHNDAQVDTPALHDLYHATMTGGPRLAAATADLFAMAKPWITRSQQHDLQAISLAYQAFQAGLGARWAEAETLLRSAHRELASGSGAFESKFIFHTMAAICARLRGLSAQAVRKTHLKAALEHLEAAGQCLPFEGAILQEAEVLHDMAMLQMALDNTLIAEDLLKIACQHLVDHGAENTYIGFLVRLGQAKAASAMIRLGLTQEARTRWAEATSSHLFEALHTSQRNDEEDAQR